MLIGSDWLSGLDLSWWMITPCCVGLLGLALGFWLLVQLSKTRILVVPKGKQPDEYYRDWKANKWYKRYSRSFFFLVSLALGMTIGGCTASLVMVLT